MIEITVNGEPRQVEEPLTISYLLARFGIHERMVVVEYNGEIVARASLSDIVLSAADRLEIVQMMAGG